MYERSRPIFLYSGDESLVGCLAVACGRVSRCHSSVQNVKTKNFRTARNSMFACELKVVITGVTHKIINRIAGARQY